MNRDRHALVDFTKRALLPFVRRYAHLELPSYGHVLHWWGMNDQPRWDRAPTVEIKDRFHGLKIKLDLSDFFQRIDYFFGCWHELDVLSAVDACLRPGDQVFEGGANIGLVTIHAASIVGSTGRVQAFEPFPKVFERLSWHVNANRLTQVTLHQMALGETPASLELLWPGQDNQAACTLGAIPERYGDNVGKMGTVDVRPGDDFIDPRESRPLLIKLDIEGFELRALKGMRRAIQARTPAIIAEVNSEMLEINGDSAEAMFDFLAQFGIEPFAIDRAGFRKRHRLTLFPLARHQVRYEKDVLWVSRTGPHWPRVVRLLAPPGVPYWRHLELRSQGYPV